MSFPKYEAYKDSGVEWLGEVPEHWSVTPLKHLVSIPITDGPHETPTFIDDGVLFVSAEAVSSGKVNFSKARYISREDHNRFSKKYKPEIYDIFMVKSGATTGIVAIVETDDEFNIWSPLAVIRCNQDNYPYFVLFSMSSQSFQESVVLHWSFGTQQNIGMGVIENLPIANPPLDEQKQIARFLARETAHIDALIAEQQRLIELLKEKRQAVISHAVTKGLDRTAPMKDSGVEWLGEVPKHWTSGRIKNLVQFVIDGPHFSPSYTDDGILFISARNVRIDGWSFSDAKFISQSDYEDFSKRVKPMKGDVLLTKGGTTGVARAVDFDEPFQVWVHIAVLRPIKNMVIPEFLAYSLNSIGCYEQSQLYTRGATNNDLGLTRIVNIQLAWPSIEEQKMIIGLLDQKISKFDTSMLEARRSIDLLQERRSALISAAVTGKIDVRNWQTPSSN